MKPGNRFRKTRHVVSFRAAFATEAVAAFALLLCLSMSTLVRGQIKLPGVVPPTSSAPTPPPALPPAPAPMEPQPIPLPQIADQAEALDLQLEEISRGLTSESDETRPSSAITSQSSEIAQRANQVDSFLDGGPDITQIREELVYWRALTRLSADQRKLLTERAAQLQDQITQLTQELEIWQATQESIHDTEGIEVVAARVQHELNAIRDLRLRAQTQLNQLLTQQNELSETGRKVSDTLVKLTDAENRFRGSIFDRDAAPLWFRGALVDASQRGEVLLRRSANQEFITAEEFLRAQGPALIFLPILFGLAVAAAFRLRGYLRSRPGLSAEVYEVFGHPLTIGLLAAMLLSMPLLQSAPLSVGSILYLLWMGLMVRLTPLLVQERLRSSVYLLMVLNFLEILRAALPLGTGMRRLMLTLLMFAVLIGFAWLARPARMRQVPLSKWSGLVLRIAFYAGLSLLTIALLANIFGFVSLSRVLGIGTLISAFFATAAYFVVRVALLALAVLLESPWLSSLSGDLRAAILLWGRRIFIFAGACLWWSRSQIYVFLLQDSMRSTAISVLDYPLGLGRIQFTLGNILTVVAILLVGFALAKAFSSVVRSVLVSKFPLQRGMPYAASKVTYYILSVLVLLAAVSAAGVDLNKFTIITGAVGVGVGFGLQDIVKNFASGLILLFERPIRVDDVIELTGMVGTVRRIGARSSTIVTAQGAEVIVPNSNLVSTQVINWTLSSQQRRVEIAVGVAYGTDPQLVIRLLVAEAAAHESVLTNPGPVAFFIGFGDSALNFELRFWSESQDAWFQLKSDVTVAIARALAEAGIEIPFPQRDLHLRSIDPSISSQSLPPALTQAATRSDDSSEAKPPTKPPAD
jgi:potassium-dependent mechanosensitive channel